MWCPSPPARISGTIVIREYAFSCGSFWRPFLDPRLGLRRCSSKPTAQVFYSCTSFGVDCKSASGVDLAQTQPWINSPASSALVAASAAGVYSFLRVVCLTRLGCSSACVVRQRRRRLLSSPRALARRIGTTAHRAWSIRSALHALIVFAPHSTRYSESPAVSTNNKTPGDVPGFYWSAIWWLQNA